MSEILSAFPFEAFARGAGLMLSLIVAIGAQNIFVISQGLAKSHVAAVCAICALCDAVLTGIGIFLIGGSLGENPNFALFLGAGGVVFLLCYALASFRSAVQGSHFAKIQNSAGGALTPVVAKALAVTLLNPHVYLDTVVVVGSLGATIESTQKPWFLRRHYGCFVRVVFRLRIRRTRLFKALCQPQGMAHNRCARGGFNAIHGVSDREIYL